MFSFAVALVLGSAQTPSQDQAIIVTGTRYTREQARERAAQFVDRMGIGAGDRPVARWTAPVCPNVQGIEERLAARVEARMRAAAAAAGISVAPAGCETNIVVRFTADAGPVMRHLAQRAPRYLEDVPAAEREAMFAGHAPVRWVYATDTVSQHGLTASQGQMMFGGGGQGGVTLPPGLPVILNYSNSMISTQTARVITGAAVVVDANLATGRLLDSVADYVAFVAFAEIRPNDPAPDDFILTLFEEPRSAPTLTEWDIAFLSALYRIPLDRMGRRHRGMLISELVSAARQAGRTIP